MILSKLGLKVSLTFVNAMRESLKGISEANDIK